MVSWIMNTITSMLVESVVTLFFGMYDNKEKMFVNCLIKCIYFNKISILIILLKVRSVKNEKHLNKM